MKKFSDIKSVVMIFFFYLMSVIINKELFILMDIFDKECVFKMMYVDIFMVVEFIKVFLKLEKLEFIEWLKLF